MSYVPGLLAAYGINPQGGELVAFVGAGGKSSLMFALAAALPGRTLVTTTTRMFAGQIDAAAAAIPAKMLHLDNLAPLEQDTAGTAVFLLTGPQLADKVTGVPLALPGQVLRSKWVDWVLVEADGARMLPVKAPAKHEPVIPPEATLVVPVVGIDGWQGRISAVAHRPERVAAALGKQLDDQLTATDLAMLLSGRQLGLKGIPTEARAVATVNKVDNATALAAARQVARHALRESRLAHVVLASARAPEKVIEVHRRVVAAVLAAGRSERMGTSKQLLPWGETTMLSETLRNLKRAALDGMLVVTGHEAERVEAVATAEGVATLYNPYHARGMLSSLQAAVAQLEDDVGAVLVALADQPRVGPETIDRLLIAYWRGEGDIVAPEFAGQRGNPVLIGRRHFAELLALPAGAAPRDLLRRHEVSLVAVDTAAVLQDIDRPEDYEQLRPR